MTPRTIVSSLLNILGFKLNENLRIKKIGRMNGQTNLVTESLFELLIAAKNDPLECIKVSQSHQERIPVVHTKFELDDLG